MQGKGPGTIVALTSALCQRIRQEGHDREHYVRLRILLQGAARNLFTSEETVEDIGLSPMQDVLETTEFRLNERRSYPPAILQRATTGRVDLRSVHYFLIRSKGHQLGSQHQNFRKVRYLEHDIWTNYLAVGQDAKQRSFSARHPKGMIIYQWRDIVKDDENGLDDFIAYASFRTAQPKILAYMIAVLAIGVVGNAVLNVGLATTRYIYCWLGWPSPGDGRLNLGAVIIGLCLVFFLPLLYKFFRKNFR